MTVYINNTLKDIDALVKQYNVILQSPFMDALDNVNKGNRLINQAKCELVERHENPELMYDKEDVLAIVIIHILSSRDIMSEQQLQTFVDQVIIHAKSRLKFIEDEIVNAPRCDFTDYEWPE